MISGVSKYLCFWMLTNFSLLEVFSFVLGLSGFPHRLLASQRSNTQMEFRRSVIAPDMTKEWSLNKPIEATYEHDLWIVGAGTLGKEVAKIWLSLHPESTVVAETLSERSHDELRSMGVTPRLRSSRCDKDRFSALNVLICFPPSSAGMPVEEELSEASKLWVGSEVDVPEDVPEMGCILYTSSSAVYGDTASGDVNEFSPVDNKSPRSSKYDFYHVGCAVYNGSFWECLYQAIDR
jgi:hypothetical protein